MAERIKQAIPTFSPQDHEKVVKKIFDPEFGASWKSEQNKQKLAQFREELGGSYENWAKEKIKNGLIEYIDTDLKTENILSAPLLTAPLTVKKTRSIKTMNGWSF